MVNTPDGVFTIVASEEALLASGWTDDLARLIGLIHPRLRPYDVEPSARSPLLREASQAVGDYYDGDLTAPCRVPARQQSGPFRQAAWAALRTIQVGQPITYAELAARSGNPAAIRAAGSACASNAVALFVPCHRVIRSDGGLGGFAYGVPLKRGLLDREARA